MDLVEEYFEKTTRLSVGGCNWTDELLNSEQLEKIDDLLISEEKPDDLELQMHQLISELVKELPDDFKPPSIDEVDPVQQEGPGSATVADEK